MGNTFIENVITLALSKSYKEYKITRSVWNGQSIKICCGSDLLTVTAMLIKYHQYSRKDVHEIFAPETPFIPQAGTWGLQGIIPIPNRPGDFVFFVTFGQRQGDHVFDEGITHNGVLTWQS